MLVGKQRSSLAGWRDGGWAARARALEALAGGKRGVCVNGWCRMLERVQQVLLPTRIVTAGGRRVQLVL